MGAQPDELQSLVVRLAVNQNQIGLYMAVAMIFPFAAERMVAMACFQCFILHQRTQHSHHFLRESAGMTPFHFTLVVSFELAGAFNRPH